MTYTPSNETLITSAPALLEALELAKQRIEWLHGHSTANDDILETINNAIKQAKGE